MLVAGLATLVLGLVAHEFLRHEESAYIDQEKEKALELWAKEYEAAMYYHESLASFIIDELMADEALIGSFAGLSQAEDAQKDTERTKLQQASESFYARLKTRGIKQLHFHAPDATSLLRMHKPEKFGDSLKGIRPTVVQANETQEFVSGFEEGRIYNGYRYVHPISWMGEHIGTVETSFSTDAIARYMAKLYPARRYVFAMRKAVVEEKVFEELQDAYRACNLTDEFVIEHNQWAENPSLVARFPPEEQPVILNKLIRAFAKLEETSEPGVAIAEQSGRHYLLGYQPVENLEGKEVAALFTLSPAKGVDAIVQDHQQLRRYAWMGSAVFGFLLGLSFFLWRTRTAQERAAFRQVDRLTRHLPGMVYQYKFDPESGRSCFPYSNAGIKDIYGVEPSEVSKDATAVFHVIHPEDRERVAEGIRQSAAQLSLWHDEYRVCFGDSQEVYWREGYATPELLEDDSVLWHGFITDVTDRKQSEQKLQESETRFNVAIEGTEAGIWDWDMVNETVSFSKQWKAMLGYEDAEIENSFEGWKKLWHPEDAAAIEKSVADHLNGITRKYEIVHRCRHKDGSWRWLMTRGQILRDESGKPYRWVGTNVDITPQKQAEEDGKNAREQAEQANKAKSAFLATMSHEIRTPLNAVIGMAALLEQTPLNEQQKDYARTILGSSDALLSLINDILDYSKIEAGRLELENAPFDLSDVITGPLEIMAGKASEKAIELTYTIDAETPATLIGDSTRLRQVILNLLSNAIKFTESGEVAIRVDAEAKDDGLWRLTFTVSDSGIGMDEAAQKRLFQPFVQADSSTTRKHGGTGLGLAICKRIVEHMGGAIRVSSKPGEGSSFSYTLDFEVPANTGKVFQPEGESILAEPGPTTSITPTLKILVADDNKINQQVLLATLQTMGHEVSCADNGQDAVEQVESASFHLVFMDMQMPVMDGLTATRHIHESIVDARQRPVIVALTANAMQGDRERCLKAGMDDYLSKPVKPQGLSDCIKKHFGDKSPQDVQVSTIGDDIPVIDRAYLRELSDTLGPESCQGFMHELYVEFCKTLDDCTSQMRKAFANRDTATLLSCAHKLKGASGALGLMRLSEYLGGVQHDLIQSGDDVPPDLLEKLHALAESAGKAFQRYQESL